PLTPCSCTMPNTMMMNAPVGPPICTRLPLRSEITSPAIIAVINPFSGDTPDAIAKAMAKGKATMPTIIPDKTSLVSCFLLMPSLSKEINLGVNSLSFTLYKFDFVRFKFGQLIRDACRFQPLATLSGKPEGISAQRSSIRAVADFKAITCPPTQNFIKCINLKFITSPAIALIQCCAIVLSFLSSVCVGKDTLFDKLWLVRLDCTAWQCVWL